MNNKTNQWSGEHYKKNKGFQGHEWAINSVDQANLIGNETILDIGCGIENKKSSIREIFYSLIS